MTRTHTTAQIAVSLAFVALAASFSGCAASVGERAGILSSSTEGYAPGTANASAGAPLVLFLTTSGALAATPPDQEGYVTLPQPVNAPFIGGAPAWQGNSTKAANYTNVTLRLFVTSSSANIAANAVPVVPLPSVSGEVISRNRTVEVHLDAPPVIRTGDIVEIKGHAALPGGFDASAFKLRLIPYYSHATTVSEFRFVMGPQHPANMTLD